jgi:hypothetical protein
MGDADERSKQIEGIKVVSNIAALDRAFHQRSNRALDQANITFRFSLDSLRSCERLPGSVYGRPGRLRAALCRRRRS